MNDVPSGGESSDKPAAAADRQKKKRLLARKRRKTRPRPFSTTSACQNPARSLQRRRMFLRSLQRRMMFLRSLSNGWRSARNNENAHRGPQTHLHVRADNEQPPFPKPPKPTRFLKIAGTFSKNHVWNGRKRNLSSEPNSSWSLRRFPAVGVHVQAPHLANPGRQHFVLGREIRINWWKTRRTFVETQNKVMTSTLMLGNKTEKDKTKQC